MSNIDEKLAILETKSQFNQTKMFEQSEDIKSIKESAAKIEIGMAIIAQKLDNLSTHETRIKALEDKETERKGSFKVWFFLVSLASSAIGWLSCYFSRQK